MEVINFGIKSAWADEQITLITLSSKYVPKYVF